MANWILIAILLVLIFIIVRFKELKHRIFIIFIIVLILFGILSIGAIYTKNEVDLTSFEGLVAATKLYTSWLKTVYINVAQLTGQAVKQDWGINITNITKFK